MDVDEKDIEDEFKEDYKKCMSYWTKKDEKSWKTYSLDKLEPIHYAIRLQELQAKNTKFEKGKIPTDVWKKNNHTTSKEYAGWHPTQKPVALLERIIKANSNEGDVVLDVFNGSASTTIACNKTNRTFWGCEFDKEYYEKSLKRIEDMQKYTRRIRMFDIVVLSGGFDPIHIGHARMIIAASKLGAEVVVGVNSDNWLERKKGYAFMPWSERAEMVESIKGVTKAIF
jgi:cytidyltransferase-like protein